MGQVIQGSFQWNIIVIVGRDSEVGIAPATGWTVRGLDPRWGRGFSHSSRLALGTTQPSLYSGYRVILGCKAAE